MFNYLLAWAYLLGWAAALCLPKSWMSGGTQDNRRKRPLSPVGAPTPPSPIKSPSHTRPSAYSEPSSSRPNIPATMPGIHAPDMEPDLQSVFSDFSGRSDYPTAGFTYIILHQPTNRALSIIKGKLALHRVPEPIPGVSHPSLLEGKTNWHWECVEADNWLSFRNAATGRFLGHDADGDDRQGRNANRRSGNFRCSSTQPGPSEKFAFLSLRSGVMAPSVMLSNGEVDGFEEFGPEEDNREEDNGEYEEGGIAERDMEEFGDRPQSQASAMYSLLVQPQRLTPCYLHRVAGCPACASGSRKLVKVQVRPEGWAVGSQVKMFWDADEDDGTFWRFVKVVPPTNQSAEEEVMA